MLESVRNSALIIASNQIANTEESKISNIISDAAYIEMAVFFDAILSNDKGNIRLYSHFYKSNNK